MRGTATSLSGVLEEWERRGFTYAFIARDSGLFCTGRGRSFRPHLVRVDDVRRFEGASDPSDSVIAFAITASDGATRGTYVVSYGADTPRVDIDVVQALPNRAKTS